jgi:hypothetical protein
VHPPSDLSAAARAAGFERRGTWWYPPKSGGRAQAPIGQRGTFPFRYPAAGTRQIEVVVTVRRDGSLALVSYSPVETAAPVAHPDPAGVRDEAAVGRALATPDAPSLTTLDADGGELRRDVPEKIVSAPMAAGIIDHMIDLRRQIDAGLDAYAQYMTVISDGFTRAIDQVQDMRITWMEQGPEIRHSEILVEVLFAVGAALLSPALGAGVAAALGASALGRRLAQLAFLKRFRAFQRRELFRERVRGSVGEVRKWRGRLREVATDRDERLRRVFQEWLRIKERRREVARELSRLELSVPAVPPVGVRTLLANLNRKETELATAVQTLTGQAFREINEAEVAVTKALDASVRQLKQRVATARAHEDTITRGMRQIIDPAIDAIVEAAKDGFKKYRGDPPRLRASGQSPIVFVRAQAQRFRYDETQKVDQIRRECDALLRLAMSGESVETDDELLLDILLALTFTLQGVHSLPISDIDYEVYVSAVAVFVEQLLWALLLGRRFQPGRSESRRYDIIGSATEPVEIPATLAGVEDRVIGYLLVLFELAAEPPEKADAALKEQLSLAIKALHDDLVKGAASIVDAIMKRARKEAAAASEGDARDAGGDAPDDGDVPWFQVTQPPVFRNPQSD